MINKLKAFFKDKNAAALIMSEENICYFTSFHSSNGYLIVTGEKAYFFTDSRYIEAAQNRITSCDEVLLLKSVKDDIVPFVESLGKNELYIEAERITLSKYTNLKTLFASVTVNGNGELDKKISEIRTVKTREQVNTIIKAQRIAEKAFDHILTFIKEGVTEKEIALTLEYFMLKNGADALSFETIAVSGRNSSMPHGVPTDKKVEKGDFITMDYGAVCDFYHSDMTRTVAVGEVTSKQIEVYETVLKAQEEAFKKMKAGVFCKSVDKAARDIIEKAGYGEFFGHGLGHGVGVEIHELPTLNPSSETILEEGHIVTNEPGIYLPGEFGVRIEDMALVTDDGYENLTKSDKKLIVL